jgi:hypothetical protein
VVITNPIYHEVIPYMLSLMASIVASAIQSNGKENVGKENNKSSIFLSYIFLSAGRNDDPGSKGKRRRAAALQI